MPGFVSPEPENDAPLNGASSTASKPTASKRRVRLISLSKIVPSLITMMALIAGITSIQKAIMDDFEAAILLIVAAGVLDILDGAVARLLKAQSEFGAQLDSLSDFLAFGVAPTILLHSWIMADAGKLGWMASVVFPVATALRLARFNVTANHAEEIPQWKKRYFTGVPSPAGAGLVMMPLYIWLMFPNAFDEFRFANPLVALWAIFVASLMVSRLPTGSFKYLKLPDRMAVPLMGAITLLIAALINAPWVTLTLLTSGYLISIPIVFRHYRKLERQYEHQTEDISSLAFGINDIEITPTAEDDDQKPLDRSGSK